MPICMPRQRRETSLQLMSQHTDCHSLHSASPKNSSYQRTQGPLPFIPAPNYDLLVPSLPSLGPVCGSPAMYQSSELLCLKNVQKHSKLDSKAQEHRQHQVLGRRDVDLGKPLVATDKAIFANQLRQEPGCRGYAASLNDRQAEDIT